MKPSDWYSPIQELEIEKGSIWNTSGDLQTPLVIHESSGAAGISTFGDFSLMICMAFDSMWRLSFWRWAPLYQ